jgi:hypothetical protein
MLPKIFTASTGKRNEIKEFDVDFPSKFLHSQGHLLSCTDEQNISNIFVKGYCRSILCDLQTIYPEIDIDELKMHIANIEASGRGAVRRLANALDQYQSILTALGKDHLTELDYENDQARYHIMTAFNQALTAARSRGGLIDEGNHIYLFQLGINGALAQTEVTAFLQAEQEALNNGVAPTHEGIVAWLNLVADRFEKAPELYAAKRNMQVLNTELILENKQ